MTRTTPITNALEPERTGTCGAEEQRDNDDLLDLQRRLAERGVHLRLPNAGPEWELPQLVDVEGELPSEALIRLRRANGL